MPTIINSFNSVFSAFGSALTLSSPDSVTIANDGFVGSSRGIAIDVDNNQGSIINVEGTVSGFGTGSAGIVGITGGTMSVNVGLAGQITVRGGGIAISNAVSVHNDGLISSDSGDAINLHNDVLNKTTVVNSGTIVAGAGAFAIHDDRFLFNLPPSADSITNSGLISGGVDLGGGDDVVTNSGNGQITQAVHLGDGLDQYRGGIFADTVFGDGGNDSISGGGGADVLSGGMGADLIAGGAGRDLLYGNDTSRVNDAAIDTFVFASTADTGKTAQTRDVIADFVHASDKIDLHLIDANTHKAGNNAFTWQAAKGAAFTGVAGQLHYATSGGNMIVSGDVNGDKIADFQIELTGTKMLTKIDFIL